MQDFRYPIGRFTWPKEVTSEEIQHSILSISSLPDKIKLAIEHLNENQLDTPYRENGWTIRQVVHHIADSHMNAYIRFKLALTEDTPTIKPYDEAKWAELDDSQLSPVVSVQIIEGVHQRWGVIMKRMSEDEWSKKYHHPEHNKTFRLDQLAVMYAWHSEHHLAHITSLISRMNW